MRLRKPSPAMLVALVALFVALGGAHTRRFGLAASRSATTASGQWTFVTRRCGRSTWSNNSVRGNHVLRDSLTGGDINETRLGPVPFAANAASAVNAAMAERCGERGLKSGATIRTFNYRPWTCRRAQRPY